MTCGLFDTGFAGDAADVASLDLGICDVDQSLFTFQDAGHSSYSVTDQSDLSHKPSVSDKSAAVDTEQTPAFGLDSWSLDMLDPLGGLEDPLMDDPLGDSSLDAFVDLDSFFMGDSLLGQGDTQEQQLQQPQPHMNQEAVEVKPVINFNVLDLPSVITESFLEPSTSSTEVPPVKVKATSSRKRKAKTATAVETSMFKVPAVMIDDLQCGLDYVPTDSQTDSLSLEVVGKNMGLKRRRLSSTTSVNSEVSSTSVDFEEVEVNTLDKTTLRRIKNNIASKRSRQQKKSQLVAMEEESQQLIITNAQLKIKIVELEQMAKDMKQQLIAKMAGCA